MRQKIYLGFILFWLTGISLSQAQYRQAKLAYYLPDSLQYDPAIPTPRAVLGFDIGEWHLSHDQLLYYMRVLDQASERIVLQEYGRTYEQRPLIALTITTPANHGQIARLQAEHVQLCNPDRSANLDIAKMPVVVRLGYSVHGNEASGGNAAALMAYYLAAGQGPQIDKLLEQSIILLDPCINPDGFQRFSTWVNSHQSYQAVSEPTSREFSEVFPNGRTNHYWFDLNRDWLLLQHPESQGRVAHFHAWKPNVLTDHHEMGSDATFFFQPGVPSRTNPNTPPQNQLLTAEIAQYHARMLDGLGALYYDEEDFDDFYYGKGSTYPDINGGIGILFEQASARGHLRQTDNGLLSFAFAIRNQLVASISSVTAALALREKLLKYQRDFYQSAPRGKGAYVVGSRYDPVRNYYFGEILRQHQIEAYWLDKDIQAEGHSFKAGQAWVVPLDQAQVRLVNTLFEKVSNFKDSLFYDVSAWTLPLAFDLPYAKLGTVPAFQPDAPNALPKGELTGPSTKTGYTFAWDAYFAPPGLASDSTKRNPGQSGHPPWQNSGGRFCHTAFPGQCICARLWAGARARETPGFLIEVAKTNHLSIQTLPTGLSEEGIDLGSNYMEPLQAAQPALLVGAGINAYEAGEVWHLLDQRYQIPLTLVDKSSFERLALEKYHALILVSGNYADFSNGLNRLKDWIRQGNTLICIGSSAQWAAQNGLSTLTFKSTSKADTTRFYRYLDKENYEGAQEMGGAIFEAILDTTHPLGYGFRHEKVAVFKDNRLFAQMPADEYAAPLRYTDSPRLSGYISRENLKQMQKAPSLTVHHFGQGKVISFLDNPNFRGYWYGTNKFFANALFFARVIRR
ncbi:MAG: zinc carboxypeptidase [Microscillaceae bacterium]|nr:zinc carboxypeptidase [Microscillaceae bacterium]